MADISLIALDIDGTLLDDAGRCSAFTLKTLKRAREAGVYVCAATARPRRHTRDLPFPFDGVACLAGAYVSVGDTVIARASFAMCEAQRLYAAYTARYPEATVAIEGGDAFYGNFEDDFCQKRDIMAQPVQPVDKMFFALPDEAAYRFLNALLPEGLCGARYGAYTLVMRAGVDKLYGLRALCAYFGVPLGRALALGNDADDLTMINGTGHGAAMRNAPEAVRAMARAVTAYDNNNDGAARYIAKTAGF